MNDVLLQQAVDPAKHSSYIHELFDKSEQILSRHRLENPDLYRMVEERKAILLKVVNEAKTMIPAKKTSQVVSKASVPQSEESIYFKQYRQDQLKTKIAENQKRIHEQATAW